MVFADSRWFASSVTRKLSKIRSVARPLSKSRSKNRSVARPHSENRSVSLNRSKKDSPNRSVWLSRSKNRSVTLNRSKKRSKTHSVSLNRPLGYSKKHGFPSVFIGFFDIHDFAPVAAQINVFVSPGPLSGRFSSLDVPCWRPEALFSGLWALS